MATTYPVKYKRESCPVTICNSPSVIWMALWIIFVCFIFPCRYSISCDSSSLFVSAGELCTGVSFQGVNYKGRKIFLSGIAILCFTATMSFFFDRRWFYILYNIQFLFSFVWCIAISVVHRKRIWFILRSQRKQLLFSVFFVLLPFMCYMTAFSRKESYVKQMGLYLIVVLTFVTIHSIILGQIISKRHFFIKQVCNCYFSFCVYDQFPVDHMVI